MNNSNRRVALGGDCDGLGAAAFALNKILGRNFKHEFASEIRPATRVIFRKNHKVHKIFIDVTKRDHSILPKVTVYVAGPPCQPFSREGLGLGLADRRSGPLIAVIQTIVTLKPHIFVMEEVAGLLEREPSLTYDIVKIFKSITDGSDRPMYTVLTNIVDSFDNGLPQHRRRLYFVGIKKQMQLPGINFSWPPKMNSPCLDDVLLPLDPLAAPELPTSVSGMLRLTGLLTMLESKNIDGNSQTVVLDPHGGRGTGYCVGASMTLTRTRCGAGGFWLTRHNRFMRTQEMLKLQGFPGSIRYNNCKYNTKKTHRRKVTRRQLNLAIGNAMSVPVIGRILHEALRAIGYISQECQYPWFKV